MGTPWNADEVLSMAVEIERNGRTFYLRGTEIVSDPEVKKLLSDLAEWEKGHEEIFASVRAELSDDERASTAFDPDGEAELYLRAMADAHVFNVNEDAAAILSEGDTPAAVVRKALDFERDSILFFLGMKDLVPERLGTGKVDGIVKEEISHVAYLKRRLAALGE